MVELKYLKIAEYFSNSMSFYVFDFYIGRTNVKRPHADIAQ